MKTHTRWLASQLALCAATPLLLLACSAKTEESGDPVAQQEQEDVEAESPEEPEWPIPDDPALAEGVGVFSEVCMHCHIESEYAPTITDVRQWRMRMTARARDGEPRDIFVTHAIEGFNNMSPKGGRRGEDLTDQQVAAGVDYMLWAVAQDEDWTEP